jgi:hypothetical protein
LVEIATQETSRVYSRRRPDFLGAREAALDHLGLEPFTDERNEIRSDISRDGAYRSNAVQGKKKRIKFIREHQGNLFPAA